MRPSVSARDETGTVYMNRCDYLDPGLAWTGSATAMAHPCPRWLWSIDLTEELTSARVHKRLTFSHGASTRIWTGKPQCP
jgi:hypothetical protein